MENKRAFMSAGLLIVLAVSSMSGCRRKKEDTPEVLVTVQAAHPSVGVISEEIAADAILAPLAQAALAPRISAPIRAEYVQRGAHVRAGQLLITLEDRDLRGAALDSQGAVTSAQAGYTAMTDATIPGELQKAQGDLEQARAASVVADRTAEERKRLFQQGALSGRDADTAYAAAVQANATLHAAQQQLASLQSTTRVTDRQAAQGQLASARGRLQNAQAQVDYANLRSPIRGIVTERPLFPGELATAGTAVITIMDTSSLLAKLHLSQAASQKLSAGHDAEVAVPGVEEPVHATVAFISPALDPGSTTVEVWLRLSNEDGRLKVGTPVHAVLTGVTVAGALQIPASAVLPASGGGTMVLVMGEDGAAHQRAIQVGIRTDQAIQVLTGLTPSDTVITEGGYGLDEGTKVTVGKAGEGATKEEKDKD